MPPKKSKILKDKVSSEKIYEILTKEQMHAKEQKHINHIANLKDCLNYMKGNLFLNQNGKNFNKITISSPYSHQNLLT